MPTAARSTTRCGPWGPWPGGFGGNFGGGGTTFRVDDLGDLGDLFGGLFGRGRRSGGGGGTGPQRGTDVEAELHLSFEDAVKGITTSVNVTTDVRCHTCHGSGAAPGTQPMTCPQCGGTGTLQDNQGLFSLSQICPRCGGRGTIVGTPCPTCHGTGHRAPQPVGQGAHPARGRGRPAHPGQGPGPAGRNGGPSGDLYVVVRVDHHGVFGRRGRNLTLTVPVSFAEAALGTTLTVPTLDEPVTLRIPAGTPSGRTFRVKGRGVPAGKRHGNGDLLVTVEVAVPAKLSAEQRAAIEPLTEVLDPPARTTGAGA